ncbi:hypothetical protein DH2020_045661 [Rehmannia glutinosa]|uniref:Diacylglycerol kinase n=1 Tax=Rehmannia glutinosa TaxID=99300 RepID=A0ABR0UF87_REHGL
MEERLRGTTSRENRNMRPRLERTTEGDMDHTIIIVKFIDAAANRVNLIAAMDLGGPSLNFDSENFVKQFYIPSYILVPEAKAESLPDIPECPVLVFINSRSGGQLGGDLLITYRSILNENQVAGGDGTAGWLLGVVSDLKLSQPPPIATVPLGTGNNLPFSFGWGKKNPGTDRNSVLSFLEQVRKAKEMKIDSWHILMRMRVPKEGTCEPIAPLELPHSLHAFHRVSSTDDLNVEGYDTFRGGFWNYFSMGMDAQVSYAFHSERKLHPEKFKNQLVNQSTYAKLGCTQGWFFASLVHPSSRNIAQLCKVKVMKKHGVWQDLQIPQRSIVCLNLPSFSGGLNPWGTPNSNKQRDRDLTPPFVDDGLLEIVGFKDAWHGLVLLAPNGHGTRLAQAHRIRFEFHKGAADATYMRIDGEPWKQPLPVNDETVEVEISNLGQVTMLATHDCRSKSVFDPSSPVAQHDEKDSDNEDESTGEEWRKFGAAETFKIPDEVDISQLS